MNQISPISVIYRSLQIKEKKKNKDSSKENPVDNVENKRFIGMVELAPYLDVSINTIRSWVWQRKVPYLKMGRLVKFDLKEIEPWLAKMKVKTLDTFSKPC